MRIKGIMNEQNKKIQEVMEQLSVLQPTAADAPRPTAQAYRQVQAKLSPERIGWLARLGQRFVAPQRRLATGVSLAVALLIITFSFPTVRTAASDLLSLFRVQKFAAISISPEQLAILQKVADQGIMPGELEIEQEPGALTAVNSLAEAATVTGITAVRTLPTLGEPSEIFIAEGGSAQLTINETNARSLLETANLDPNLLPEGIDGARIRVVTFNGVEQRWADGTTLLQSESPVVQYPDALDPAVLGKALLQFLGMTPLEAQQLARQIDWTSTLLLPIPSNAATFQEITVNGVSGIGLSSLDGQGNALVWQENGTLYLLAGSQTVTDLASLANGIE
ncbi:hypothetical protein MNBD_CHLOROFLEXI01-1024 [hydrothermal vent metagenome]|uniref:DUF4367 domain-containing protein n=1 Tax=hydrothermal vent metagenome TaxID=652676 RepID=A0A3B0VGI3_9ZZZZ